MSSARSDQAEILELFISAILVALGVNILAGWFLDENSALALALGIAATTVPVAVLVARAYRRAKLDRELEGILIYQQEPNRLVTIDRYEFSERLDMYLDGAFVENRALEHLWNSQPLADLYGAREEELQRRRPVRTLELVRQATEYFVLHFMSIHLTDYFNLSGLDTAGLVTLTRADIPDVLLENSFLKLFSEPMEERAAFIEDSEAADSGRIVESSGPAGEIYSQFELTLPKDGRVSRSSPRSIRIETPRAGLTLETKFDGGNTILPGHFAELYLGLENLFDYSVFRIRVSLRGKLSLRGFISIRGWRYYRWIDSLFDGLEGAFSAEHFFRRIGWDAAASVLLAERMAPRGASPEPTTDVNVHANDAEDS